MDCDFEIPRMPELLTLADKIDRYAEERPIGTAELVKAFPKEDTLDMVFAMFILVEDKKFELYYRVVDKNNNILPTKYNEPTDVPDEVVYNSRDIVTTIERIK